MVNVQILSELLLHKLPPDGSAVSNTTALALLGRAVQRQVDKATYRKVVSILERQGQVRRGNGPGGSIALAAPFQPATTVAPALSEYQLMPCLQQYLEGRFWRRLNLPLEAHWKVLDTSEGGQRMACGGAATTPALRSRPACAARQT